MKKYWFEVIIVIVLLVFMLVGTCFSQQKSTNKGAPTVLLRSEVSSSDGDPPVATVQGDGSYSNVETDGGIGDPFDSSDYEKVRFYVKMSDDNTSCTIRPIIWNNLVGADDLDTPDMSGWSVDTPSVVTSVKNGYAFLWEVRHASSVSALINSISGTGTISLYIQGSN